MTFRVLAFGFAVCVLAPLGALATPAGQAHACSLVGFGFQLLPYAVESSSTIAVGRLVEAEPDVITLEVEEGLKGTLAGERLTVSNATLGLGPGCEVYLEPNGKGFALPEGARVLAFLQANELGGSAGLRSALYGYGVFTLDGDFIQDRRFAHVSFTRVRDAVRDLAREPVDLNLETVGPCNPRLDLADDANLLSNVRMSAVIAVGIYRSVGGGIGEFNVQQVFRGDAGGSTTLRINAHHFYQGAGCRATMEAGSASYPVSFKALVFLRPDDYGVTDWRGAIWGAGILAIVGDELQGAPGLPTLEEVRAAARNAGFGTELPSGSPAAQAPSSTVKAQDHYWVSVAIVAVVAAFAAAFVVVRRVRR